jgi:hypothetical protein
METDTPTRATRNKKKNMTRPSQSQSQSSRHSAPEYRCALSVLLVTILSVTFLPEKVASYLPCSLPSKSPPPPPPPYRSLQHPHYGYRYRSQPRPSATTQLQGLFQPSKATTTGGGTNNNNATKNSTVANDDTSSSHKNDNNTTAAAAIATATATPTAVIFDPAAVFANDPEGIEGIGGQGGYVYDVNSLKRNLLQETVLAYKKELWTLLLQYQTAGSGVTEWDVVDKLAALVQASPVRTTTDSNLLDGSWCLAYTSQKSNVADLKRILHIRDRTRRKKRDKNGNRRISISRSGDGSGQPDENGEQQTELSVPRNNNRKGVVTGLFQTTIRNFHLEELQDDEDAYVEDATRFFGGLLTRTRRSAVRGLTRTSLRLDALSSQWCIAGGQEISHKDAQQLQGLSGSSTDNNERKRFMAVPTSMQIVYSDVDLCISVEADDRTDSPSGSDSPFQVFTKNEAWMNPQKRFGREIQYLVTSLQLFLSRLSPRRWIHSSERRWMYDNSDSGNADPILQEYEYDAATLRVLKLGDLSDEDDEAWDGIQDPFVHLSAIERQKVLKTMNFKEIEKAGNRRLGKSWRQRWTQRLFGRKKTYFKKPGDL